MRKILLTLAFALCALPFMARTVTTYRLSDEPITKAELLEGNIKVALRVWTTSKDMYLSDGDNKTGFDASEASTVWNVVKSGSGITLQNVKSLAYLAGEGSTFGRSTDASKAKVFTPVKISNKVDNTAAGADESRSFWFTFKVGTATWYLNTNTSGYQTVKYATGNGNWSTMYVYKVVEEKTLATPIIPVPTKTVALDGTNSNWTWDGIQTAIDSSLQPEAYTLDITTDSISIKAGSEKGIYYAHQTLIQLDEQGHELPCLHIEDQPRFGYRGFMLDVSRHFFSVEEVKKMLDIMARYKMNVFHWHLTDDQGWRAEIKRYPKLTTVGATRSDNYDTPITMVEENGQIYWTGNGGKTGKQYGPYFYTQDEMREVVAYAAERHIDILPEVDMPGHFVAAMAAYPEYCCHPQSAPQVWTGGGISGDVLNVANPAAVEFAKNILDELCDIFPYPYIHIGGDECPTGQWENNALCQQKYQELGLNSYRALQTHFIKEMSDFVKTKNKQIICWNECIIADGTDVNLMKETGATIMSWIYCQSSVRKAVEMGLPAIVTEYHTAGGGYYINRKQSSDYGEPSAAGYGDDTVEGCYNYVPVQGQYTEEQLKLIKGVQGTFWTEHVGTNEYLEYLALPRLICVAEAGWSQQSQKDWGSFRERLTNQLPWLDANGYIYARHWMEDYIPRVEPKPENEQVAQPVVSSVDNPKWFRIKFTEGNTYLQMNGPNLATVAAFQNDKSQYFALIPTSTSNPSVNNFKLYSANGYWVTMKEGTATNGQSGNFLCGSETKGQGTNLCVQQHPTDASKYVISKVTDKTTGFNTWGGTGAGSNVGFWDKNAAGDKLVFTTDDYNAGTTAIIGVHATDNLAYTPAVYNLSGMRLDQLQPGINIVRRADGSIKKLLTR